jgi:DNA-binding transcriptional regulator YiaG
MGVTEATVLNWEKGETEPAIQCWPAIIAFLGYDPIPVGVTLPDRMAAFRRLRGLSIKQVAARAGVDPDSWAVWERAGRAGSQPSKRSVDRIECLLEADRDPGR